MATLEPITRIETYLAKIAGANVTTPEPVTRIEQFLDDIQTAADPFVVTLTPTEQDYSGTMDKTSAEIQTAYEAGKSIVFDLVAGAGDITCIATPGFSDNFIYPSFNGFLLVQSPLDALVYLWTGTTDDPDHNTYHTVIYPLTPRS